MGKMFSESCVLIDYLSGKDRSILSAAACLFKVVGYRDDQPCTHSNNDFKNKN